MKKAKPILFLLSLLLMGADFPNLGETNIDRVYLRKQEEGEALVIKFSDVIPQIKAVYSRNENASEIRFNAKTQKPYFKERLFSGAKDPYKKLVFWSDPKTSECLLQLWYQGKPKVLPVWLLKNAAEKKIILPLFEQPKKREEKSRILSGEPAVEKERKISLKVRATPLDKLLKTVAAEAERGLIFSDEVSGSVTVNIQDLSYEDAIDSILRPTAYRAEHGKSVTIIRGAKTGRIFKVFQLQYVDANPVVQKIKDVMKDANLTVDSHTNSIFVNDSIEAMTQIENMLIQIDRPTPQVEVEAAIIEMADADSRDVRVELAADVVTHTSPSETGHTTVSTTNLLPAGAASTAPSGFFLGLTWKSVTGVLGALAQKSTMTVLARPRVLALNDEEASILIGSRLGYKTTTVSAIGGALEDVKFLTVGTQLMFRPHITENKHILLDIKPEISEGSIDQVTLLPSEKTTGSETKVMVQDGQTIILGGLLRDRAEAVERKVPILGDIPLVGFFFRGSTETKTKSEIMILLSPKIVDPGLELIHKRESDDFLDRAYERALEQGIKTRALVDRRH